MWNPIESVLSIIPRNELMGFDYDLLKDLSIPDRTKEYLSQVGLPISEILLCKFYFSRQIISLKQFISNKEMKCNLDTNLYRIGSDGGGEICLSNSGNIFVVYISEDMSKRFVNTNIETFCGFLALYVKACNEYSKLPDQDKRIKAIEFTDKLKGYDPKAFEDNQTWWSLICEQMKYGLL